MKLTGGSLKINELLELLKASYEEHSDKNILTYELDEKLSNLYGKVYVDNINKKVVLAHRGTRYKNMGSDRMKWLMVHSKNIKIVNSNLLDILKVLYYLDYCQIKH